MTMGVFVQFNEHSPRRDRNPTGHVIQENGCWEWVGALHKDGYGKTFVDGRYVYAHRVMYERVKGAIPPDLQLDHLCRNRGCVNPDHLETVTSIENTRRGVRWQTRPKPRTHCLKGHPFDEGNTYFVNCRTGAQRSPIRGCVICRSVRQKRYKEE